MTYHEDKEFLILRSTHLQNVTQCAQRIKDIINSAEVTNPISDRPNCIIDGSHETPDKDELNWLIKKKIKEIRLNFGKNGTKLKPFRQMEVLSMMKCEWSRMKNECKKLSHLTYPGVKLIFQD